MQSSFNRLSICLGLVAAVLLAYAGVWHCDYVGYDDVRYILETPQVRAGLTWPNVAWAFTHFHEGHWMPLTWISHMLDVTLFGTDPGPAHLVNVAWHAASTLLLFAVLLRTTKQLWPSACVAALFALHPLNVESVAWLAERKNVLSTFFWLLAMWCYVRHAEKPRTFWLALTTLSMAGGLMVKSMLVTLPCALLLLDVWPLRRAGTVSWRRLLAEKVPLFALSGAACWMQILSARSAQMLWTQEASPLGARVVGALANVLRYFELLFFPHELALPYPMPAEAPIALAALSLMLLAGLLSAGWRLRKSMPWLLIGLLWFLGTLIPVSGLVQAGDVVFADRYTYVPGIGIFIAVVWSLAAVPLPRFRWVKPVFAAACLGIFGLLSARYVECWHDTETLFTHAARVLPQSVKAHSNAGLALAGTGHFEGAIAHYESALRIDPHQSETQSNLGVALSKLGRTAEAIAAFRQAVAVDPGNPTATFNLGTHLLRAGDAPGAIAVLSPLVAAEPDQSAARYWLGRSLETAGDLRAAQVHYELATRLNPRDPSPLTALKRVEDLIAALGLPHRGNLDRFQEIESPR